MSKKIPKPPWVNHITRRDPKAYVTELPVRGAKHAYYNIIGTDVWVEWVDDKWIRVNPDYVHAEYEAWFFTSDPDAYKCIGVDHTTLQDITAAQLIAARDYIETQEEPPSGPFPTGPLYFRI